MTFGRSLARAIQDEETMTTAQAKVCIACQQDVSAKPRSKDAHGRYVCKECEAKALATGAATRAAASAASAGENVGPSAAKAADTSVKAPSGSTVSSGGYDLFAEIPQPCPSCLAPMKSTASVCTICGFNKETGKALRTQVSVEKGVKKPGGDIKLPVSWDVIAGSMAALVVLAGVAACVTPAAIIPLYIILSVNGFIGYVMTVIIPFQDSATKWGAYNLLSPVVVAMLMAVGYPVMGLIAAVIYPIAVLYYVFSVNYRSSLKKVYLVSIGGSVFLAILFGLYGPEKIVESMGLDWKDFQSDSSSQVAPSDRSGAPARSTPNGAATETGPGL